MKLLVAVSLALTSLFVIKIVDINAQIDKTSAPVALSELSTLKAENHKLKIQLTQCRVDLLDSQAQNSSTSLSAEQKKLEDSFRSELKCKADDKFDWTNLKCGINEKANPPK